MLQREESCILNVLMKKLIEELLNTIAEKVISIKGENLVNSLNCLECRLDCTCCSHCTTEIHVTYWVTLISLVGMRFRNFMIKKYFC